MSTLFDSDIQRGPVELPETGIRLTDLCEQLGVYNSKGEARRAIEGGGLYLNGLRVENPVCSIHRSDLLHDKHIILRKGKKEYFVVTLDPVAAVAVK
jgi:tyrosyl-tRNA synthetase